MDYCRCQSFWGRLAASFYVPVRQAYYRKAPYASGSDLWSCGRYGLCLIVILFLVSFTGLLLLAVRSTSFMELTLAIHLGFVYSFFLIMPCQNLCMDCIVLRIDRECVRPDGLGSIIRVLSGFRMDGMV